MPVSIDIPLNLSQPDLSGALFAAAERRQKSGNGGRIKLHNTTKIIIQSIAQIQLWMLFTLFQ
jgi:hypothetical protein